MPRSQLVTRVALSSPYQRSHTSNQHPISTRRLIEMSKDKKYRIGVDVGGKIWRFVFKFQFRISLLCYFIGTNTDSVIVDITRTKDPSTRGVIATCKHETTVDITTGIELAVKKVLEQVGISHGSDSDQILSLTIGTTVEHTIYFFLCPDDLSILAFHQCDCTARCNQASKSGRHSTRSPL